jgi:hypothetical protein
MAKTSCEVYIIQKFNVKTQRWEDYQVFGSLELLISMIPVITQNWISYRVVKVLEL